MENDLSELARAVRSLEATITKEARLRRRLGIWKFVVLVILILFVFRPDLFVFQPQFLYIFGGLLLASILALVVGGLLGISIGTLINKLRATFALHKR